MFQITIFQFGRSFIKLKLLKSMHILRIEILLPREIYYIDNSFAHKWAGVDMCNVCNVTL